MLMGDGDLRNLYQKMLPKRLVSTYFSHSVHLMFLVLYFFNMVVSTVRIL